MLQAMRISKRLLSPLAHTVRNRRHKAYPAKAEPLLPDMLYSLLPSLRVQNFRVELEN